jgi:hypothetical protein
MSNITALITGILDVTFATVSSEFLVTGIAYPHDAVQKLPKIRTKLHNFHFHVNHA